jgi:hypothetical protein
MSPVAGSWNLRPAAAQRPATVSVDVAREQVANDFGWVSTLDNSGTESMIVFGKRSVRTLNSVLERQYTFSTRASISLRLRHYWSQVEYTGYYLLDENGKLNPSDYQGSHDINFNAFHTADAQFVWYFAPGAN